MWSLNRVAVDTTTADSTEPLTLHASLPRRELWDTVLPGVRDEHQVISIEKLPWHTNVELTQERF